MLQSPVLNLPGRSKPERYEICLARAPRSEYLRRGWIETVAGQRDASCRHFQKVRCRARCLQGRWARS